MSAGRPVVLALVTPPWYGIQTPPTATAALAAFVRSRTSARVECHHPYLRVADVLGYGLYRDIGETQLGGLLGSVLCFDGDREKAAREIRTRIRAPTSGPRRLLGRRLGTLREVRSLLDRVEAALRDWFSSTDWGRYDLIGFSNSHAQLFFSLYLVAQLRRQDIRATIVLGGSECSPTVVPSLTQAFSEVDAFVAGEGELALTRHVEALQRFRHSGRAVAADPTCGAVQLDSLDDLPHPDYDEYFTELARTTIEEETRRHLEPIVEVGRGCYWSKPVSAAPPHTGCAFCGEKHLWRGYRHKSVERVVDEVSELVSRHHISRAYLGDSGIRPRLASQIFRRIGERSLDLEFSLNVRPNVPPELFALFEEGGVKHLTIGFEALSTGALRIMNKGTQVIQVLYMLKMCEQHGIGHHGKLICYHPGVRDEDLEETLHNLDFAKWYAPLHANRFQLITGSPIHAAPDEFGVLAVRNHPIYRSLMPDWAFNRLELFRKQYVDANREVTYPLWSRVEARLLTWAAEYDRLHASNATPLLEARDIGSAVEIRSRELVDDKVVEDSLRLTGQATKLYRACRVPERRGRLAESLGISEQDVSATLDTLVERRVVFREGERYLALAVDGGRHG